jgi:hypothetical protein
MAVPAMTTVPSLLECSVHPYAGIVHRKASSWMGAGTLEVRQKVRKDDSMDGLGTGFDK